MSRYTIEELIKGTNDGQARVRADTDATSILITWDCGDGRSFTPEHLEKVVEDIERMGDREGVWIAHKDSNGQTFLTVNKDGDIYANTTPEEITDDSRGIDWDELVDAVHDATENMKKNKT